jgi:hypothetical protein
VKIRCTIDGLLLHAEIDPVRNVLIAFDSGEAFVMEAIEAGFYELVAATAQEIVQLEQAHYRLLRRAWDFRGLICPLNN